jgi:hypothetical protein
MMMMAVEVFVWKVWGWIAYKIISEKTIRTPTGN